MKSTLPNQERFVRSLQSNQAADFTLLYKAYSPALYSMVLRMVKDADQAQDLLQDAFIKIWANRHRYDPTQGRLFTWLLRVTRNVVIDKLKAQKKHQPISIEELADYSETWVNPQTAQGRIETSLIGQLDTKYQIILDLYYGRSYTAEEVAQHLSVPEGTVKTRLRKALYQLRVFYRQDILQYQAR